jgi:hypothetical protein
MPHATITVESNDLKIADLRAMLDKQNKRDSVLAFAELLRAGAAGVRRCYMRANLASEVASGTVTCDQSAAVDATDDITIGGTTLSVEETPADTSEFDSGTTDAEFADNLAAAINANATISKMVWAVSDGASVVTIYSVFPGPIGNLVTLAETGNGMTLSGANLSSGASDEVDTYQFGYDPSA